NFVKIESIGSIKKSTKLKTKKIALTLLGVGVFVFALIFVFSMFSIYSSVEAMCTQVRSQYEGDCVEGLIQYVESEEHDYEEKNRAIWALGQLADERALPTLNQFYEFSYAEVPCKRDLHICREEVEKAIKWCTKGNVTSWMYNF
ncbi:hypothetical protein KKF04_04975, partial [Patescibacteria group bacterium]|nr:hypothetical protein [Patescibacteria group bacterium]